MKRDCPSCGVEEGMLHRPDCRVLAADEPKIGPNRGNAGKGRPKGSANKATKAIKDMVVEALDKAGGVEYLLSQSKDNPTAFLTLVGKIVPLQVNAAVEGQLKVSGALAWKPPQ